LSYITETLPNHTLIYKLGSEAHIHELEFIPGILEQIASPKAYPRCKVYTVRPAVSTSNEISLSVQRIDDVEQPALLFTVGHPAQRQSNKNSENMKEFSSLHIIKCSKSVR
jgi:hypothetical protein